MTDAEAHDFIRAHTCPARAPLVPEFTLQLASEITPIWQATEDWLAVRGMAPPFWAFAWPGAQALARLLLDEPDRAAGRRVLDFAAGCGLAGLAAARAGAARVEACEIDRLALAAIALNAARNGLELGVLDADVVGQPCRWDLILCGDVCYEAPMARAVTGWLRQCAASGADVWVADPGRAYVPTAGRREIGWYDVPTTLELEDRLVRRTSVFALLGEGSGQQDGSPVAEGGGA